MSIGFESTSLVPRSDGDCKTRDIQLDHFPMDPRYESLADNLVSHSTNLQEAEKVLIERQESPIDEGSDTLLRISILAMHYNNLNNL